MKDNKYKRFSERAVLLARCRFINHGSHETRVGKHLDVALVAQKLRNDSRIFKLRFELEFQIDDKIKVGSGRDGRVGQPVS